METQTNNDEKEIKCPDCDGTGNDRYDIEYFSVTGEGDIMACGTCNGSGRIKAES